MRDRIYYNSLWLGLAAILIFTPIARGAVRVWSITPVLLIESFLLLLWLWRVNNDPVYRFKKTRLDLPVILFAILAAVSFIFSIYRHDSFYALLRLFGYIGIYYIVVNEFDHNMRRRIIWLVISLGSALSVYGLLQYFGLFSHFWWYPEEFLAATFVNHNHFAGYLELIMPLAAVMVFNRKGNRTILSASLVIMITAFILTQSRGAWVSLLVSLSVMGFIFMRNTVLNKKAVIIFLLVLIALFSLVYFARDVIFHRMDTVSEIAHGKEASVESRLQMWQGALRLVREDPVVGTGIGTFIWAFPRYRPEGFYALANFTHNDYLNMASEMGIAAPFLMIWIFAIIIKAGFLKKNNELNPYAFGCAIGMLSLSIHGLTDFNFHIPSNMLLFSVWAGIVMRENRPK